MKIVRLGSTPKNAPMIKDGLITNIPLELILKMTKPEAGFVKTMNGNHRSLFQVSKMESPRDLREGGLEEFQEIIRLIPDGAPGVEPDYMFSAMVTPQYPPMPGVFLTFNVHSWNFGEVHPAMDASKFISWAYEYFYEAGYPIFALTAHWLDLPDQINAQQYKKMVRSGTPREEAVKLTWTGRQFAKLGYTYPLAIQEVDKGPGLGREHGQVLIQFLRPGPMAPTQPTDILSTAKWVTSD